MFLLQKLLGFDLLVEGVGFDLVNCRNHFVINDEVYKPIRIEVADTDGFDAAISIQLLHRPPRAVNVAVGLVDQIQVEVIQSQLVQRPLESLLGAFVTSILNPEFGGDENLVSRHATLLDGFADGFFVAVRSCRVNQTVADFDRVRDASFTCLQIAHLEDAKP